MGRPRLPVTLDRYLSRTTKTPTGCRVLPGGVGYATVTAWPLRAVAAHRVVCELAHGPIPDGWEVDHLCDVPRCIEPTHLEAVPRVENERRKTERERRPTGHQPHPCGKCGGPRDGVSRRGDGRTFAFCVPCQREYQRTRHAAAVRARSRA